MISNIIGFISFQFEFSILAIEMQFGPQNILVTPSILNRFLANPEILVAYSMLGISTDSYLPITSDPGKNCKKLGFGVVLVRMKMLYLMELANIFSIIIIITYSLIKFMKNRCFRVLGHESFDDAKKLHASPQHLTETIVKNNQFVYIDINAQNGLNSMESIDPDDMDVGTEKIGQNLICNLRQLSKQTQNTMDYIYKLQQLRKMKNKYKQLLKDQISKSQRQQALSNSRINQRKEKRAKIQQSYKTKSTLKEKVALHKALKGQKLKQLLEKKELEKRNSKILSKEISLIEKYGLTNEYQTIVNPDLKSPIIRKKGKLFLPEINSLPQLNSK